MGVAGILVIAAIAVLSAVGVCLAEEPVDTVVEVEAAIGGFGVVPLASKVATVAKTKSDRRSVRTTPVGARTMAACANQAVFGLHSVER